MAIPEPIRESSPSTTPSASSSPSRSLRVLLVLEAADTGAGRHCLDLAAGLVAAGHEVHLVYSRVRTRAWFEESAAAVRGLRLHVIGMQREPGVHDVVACLRLRRLVRDQGPFDIVHGHSSKGGALVRIAARGLGARLVYTPHALVTMDPELAGARKAIFAFAERVLGGLGDAMICVSDEERVHALELGVPADRCCVVHNGIARLPPADRSRARAAWQVPPDAICVGFVGRLSHQKAVDRLIRVFAAVGAAQPRLRLVVVGEGPDAEALRSLAADLRVAARTIFTGAMNGAAAMAGMDLFAMTSRYEAFPYVFLEALGRGLPILTTRVGGASAVVESGANGYVIDQWDADQYARRMTEIVASPKTLAAMSARSAALARDLTATSMVAGTLAVYSALLQGALPSRGRRQ